MSSVDVVIIGAGPAALTAAIYLGRAGVRPRIITGPAPGGQLVNTSLIENYPGFDVPIGGADLMAKMISQAEAQNADFSYDTVTSILKNGEIFDVALDSGEILQARSVLIATGATHNKLQIPGEEEFTNRGVSWCATCDGPMYKNKRVAVIGGGNTAVMEALFLANFCSSVLLVHRRDSLRADKAEQNKLFENGKIKCCWNSKVIEIKGEKSVGSIDILSDGEVKNKKVNGVFIAIGTSPASGFVRDLVELDSAGYVIAPETVTSCPGVFAAGDVVSGSLKQAIFAAGQGALASSKIEQYLGIR